VADFAVSTVTDVADTAYNHNIQPAVDISVSHPVFCP